MDNGDVVICYPHPGINPITQFKLSTQTDTYVYIHSIDRTCLEDAGDLAVRRESHALRGQGRLCVFMRVFCVLLFAIFRFRLTFTQKFGRSEGERDFYSLPCICTCICVNPIHHAYTQTQQTYLRVEPLVVERVQGGGPAALVVVDGAASAA